MSAYMSWQLLRKSRGGGRRALNIPLDDRFSGMSSLHRYDAKNFKKHLPFEEINDAINNLRTCEVRTTTLAEFISNNKRFMTT